MDLAGKFSITLDTGENKIKLISQKQYEMVQVKYPYNGRHKLLVHCKDVKTASTNAVLTAEETKEEAKAEQPMKVDPHAEEKKPRPDDTPKM